MLVYLKNSAAKREEQEHTFELSERLPSFIKTPCTLHCSFNVEAVDNYYLVNLKVSANLTAICQRCLNHFEHQYVNRTVMAVCSTDEMAEKLMARYEVVVSHNNQVDLQELVTDELFLYGPEFHPDLGDCGKEVRKFIKMEAE